MLEVEKLSAGYAEKMVLEDVSFQVAAGEVLAVIGPNGAGKSTLVRAISGVLTPHSGSIRISGKSVVGMNFLQRARHLAVLPQTRQLPGDFTVYQTILLGRTPYLNWLGSPGKTDHEHVRWAMERTQILEFADRRVGELSGGEQQLVLLARALAQDTPVLLLDEPTTHLDLEHQSRILKLVWKLASETNRAVLMVIHDINWAGLYANRVAIFKRGRIFAIGKPKEVLTSENLQQVYNISVDIIPHPEYDTPLVLPNGLR
jgi:iron complex transport system ATP-binding protein